MGNHAYQAVMPPRGWRGAMSLPRRIALRRRCADWQLVQRVEPSVAAMFAAVYAQRVTADERTVPIACRIILAGGATWELRLTDERGDAVAIDRADGALAVRRSGSDHPEFCAAVTIAAIGDGAVTIWLDATTIEIEGDDGACWAGVQHGLVSESVQCAIAAPDGIDFSVAAWRGGGSGAVADPVLATTAR